MARNHTQLAKSRLLQYTEIQATSIPSGTTVYEVATLPSTVDLSKEFIYVTESAKYYRIKPKEPGQYNASTEENGVMMGEPAVNVASGYEAIFVHKYPNTGSSTDNNGLSVYKPITESIDLDTPSMYTPTAQAVSKFVVPEYNTTVTSSTPTILLKENVAFKCTNAGVTSVTLNLSDVYDATNPKTRETRVYFHTGSNPTTLSLTGTGSSSMTVIGNTSLLPDKDYVVSVKDNTVVINTEPSSVLYEPVTYSQLVTKINNSQLVKGKKYRIIDYVTTTTQADTSSAGHVFDLVVTAIDVDKLDYKASALLHEGDTYFSTTGADLSKWQIWYDANNDTNKYYWADTTNGKGVIYRMIDEFNNECPYDFKNILFTIGNYTNVYTFNKFANGDSANSDHSLNAIYHICYGNVIKEFVVTVRFRRMLNFIVFDNNSINSVCYNNIFNKGCSRNVFSHHCYNNVFGINCVGNTLGNNCSENTFGDNCSGIKLGDVCAINTFGNECTDIIFGDSSTPSVGGNFFKNIIVESNNLYIRLYNTNISNNYYLQNIYIAQGCSGTYSSYTEISTIARNLSYRTTVGRDSSGNIRIYNEDDPASASQAQADWNETSSSSPSYIQNKPTLTTVTFRHW